MLRKYFGYVENPSRKKFIHCLQFTEIVNDYNFFKFFNQHICWYISYTDFYSLFYNRKNKRVFSKKTIWCLFIYIRYWISHIYFEWNHSLCLSCLWFWLTMIFTIFQSSKSKIHFCQSCIQYNSIIFKILVGSFVFWFIFQLNSIISWELFLELL